MQDDARGTEYFCYFTINNNTEMIVQCCMVALSLVLVGDAFRKFYRMRGTHNNHVTFVYRLLLSWWIVFMLANGFGILIFILFEKDPDTYSGQTMSTLTKYFFVTDWMNAFMVQWLLLYLPYQWSKQISELFDSSNLDRSSARSSRRSQIQFVQSFEYQGYETKIYKTLKLYMRFRFAYCTLIVVFLCLHNEVVLFKAMVTCLVVDCLFITLSIIFGLISLKTTEQLREQLDEDEARRTINQYIVVIIANALRFGIDLTYVISKVFGDATYNDKCPDCSSDQPAIDLAQNIITVLLTYYLPVFVILRIYNLEERPQMMCQSLIISYDYDRTAIPSKTI